MPKTKPKRRPKKLTKKKMINKIIASRVYSGGVNKLKKLKLKTIQNHYRKIKSQKKLKKRWRKGEGYQFDTWFKDKSAAITETAKNKWIPTIRKNLTDKVDNFKNQVGRRYSEFLPSK
jgi:hypothetical protein